MRRLVPFLVLLLVLAACTRGEEEAATTTTTSTSVQTTAPDTTDAGDPGPEPEPTDGPVNPLTGLPAEGLPEHRVLAVKVDNTPAGRPLVGVGEAELLYEVPVEGRLTRLVALYLTEAPSLVGPVRSARTTDADLLAPHRPVLAVSGGLDFVYRPIRAAGITIVDPDTPGAFLDLGRPAPYHLMANPAALFGLGTDEPPSGPAFPFGPDRPEGEAAPEVTVDLPGGPRLRFLHTQNGYRREEDGTPLESAPTPDAEPEPVTFDTVLVIFAAQRSAGYTDAAGNDVPTFDVIGYGPAIILHKGTLVEAEWRRASQASGVLLFEREGRPFTLPPGRLMVGIVPRSTQVTVAS